MELWRLFAHNHWFAITLFGKKIRICARCSGYLLGFSSLFLLNLLFNVEIFSNISRNWLVALVIMFILPLILDWLTQSWGLRESKNQIRFATGLLFGLGFFLFLDTSILFISRQNILTSTFLITLLGVFGKLHS
jgi:uncharacterized membrane protein